MTRPTLGLAKGLGPANGAGRVRPQPQVYTLLMVDVHAARNGSHHLLLLKPAQAHCALRQSFFPHGTLAVGEARDRGNASRIEPWRSGGDQGQVAVSSCGLLSAGGAPGMEPQNPCRHGGGEYDRGDNANEIDAQALSRAIVVYGVVHAGVSSLFLWELDTIYMKGLIIHTFTTIYFSNETFACVCGQRLEEN